MPRVNLLGLSGSLREGSYSTAVLHAVAERLDHGAELRVHPLGDVPLYNQDLDTAEPLPPVAALREAIAAADGLVIVTPEYNYGMPGMLKNALDWASRPYGAAPLAGKPVVTMATSPAFTGGVRALAQLHETLLATQSLLVPRPQTVIGQVHNKFEDGRLIDDAALDFALGAIADLRTFVDRPTRLAA